MEFLKKHYKKVLIVLFCLLFFNCCTKSCSKSNELNMIKIELDSCKHDNIKYHDSIVYLNSIINHKDIELNSKNEQINQLNKTISTVINKNAVNHIKVIVPEQEKNNKANE